MLSSDGKSGPGSDGPRPASPGQTGRGAPAPGFAKWVLGARPRTLPASVVPVLVGTGVAAAYGKAIWWRAVLAGLVALWLQIGVNYANDYSDGVRGTDATRVGPVRLVAGGLASPGAVKRAALGCFAVAGACGVVLAAVAGWWLVLVGLACVLAAWGYTGGPRPYGYAGLGEVFVFVFFGLVATVGTAYVQAAHFGILEVLAAVPVGLLAVALLAVNNLRDIPGDVVSGKRTLAVRLGQSGARAFYVACVLGAVALVVPVGVYRPWALLGMAGVGLAVAPVRRVMSGAQGRDLVPVLGATGRLQLAVGLLMAAGLAI
ncbi:MAG TPA: 1,4-dihydroxy-2-naphthoate polyprenyltransferase [Acidimicrobiales bacterium]|nr:1,4-dihydroxy-2-naphthoate polyprenyltransferase [Acidimicrobiales bacterium]